MSSEVKTNELLDCMKLGGDYMELQRSPIVQLEGNSDYINIAN